MRRRMFSAHLKNEQRLLAYWAAKLPKRYASIESKL
jgi:ribosomal protein RSM22 (predicted rRNA methylase)